MSWTCTLSASPSLGDLHSFCMTGRAGVCVGGAFGTALADNWRQDSSCTIEFGEKICPYCTVSPCVIHICTMWGGLSSQWSRGSGGFTAPTVGSHGADWRHSPLRPELIPLTMSWSASTTGLTLFSPHLIHASQAFKEASTFSGLYLPNLHQIKMIFLHHSLVRAAVLKCILSRTFPGQETSCGVELRDRKIKIKT